MDGSVLAFIEPVVAVRFALVAGLFVLVGRGLWGSSFLVPVGTEFEDAAATGRLLEAPFGFLGRVAHAVWYDGGGGGGGFGVVVKRMN